MNNLKPFFCFMLGVSATLNAVLFIDYIKKTSENTRLLRKMEAKLERDERVCCPINKT